MVTRYDKAACTEPDCNFVAKVFERIGTTCQYFRFCPHCGTKASLNVWTVELTPSGKKQVYKGEVRG